MKYLKNANLWFPSYVRDRIGRMTASSRPAKRLWVGHTDHFEPYGLTTLDNAHARMSVWEQQWPRIIEQAPLDADGKPPCFTFFYPQEEYDRGLLNRIAAMTRTGTTDVEIHIHHFDETGEGFVKKMETFKRQLHEDHGLLHQHNGRLMFGFVHGNWALDNSHPEGLCCGVKGELQLLRDLGCYADFTMPSLPSPTQSKIVNQIYWTTGDPAKPRGFDRGVAATVGGGTQGDLLMITGPTGLRYRGRLIPRLENGELAVYDPPTQYRVERWLDLAPRLGDDIFLKLYGHTAREDNAAELLGDGTRKGSLTLMYRWIAEAARERDLELHWASAYQMFCAVEKLMHPAEARTGTRTMA